MPFSPQSLSVLARNDDFTLWRYECAEDPADLLAAGYFLPAAGILCRGDLVSCVGADAEQRTALLVVDAGPGRIVLERLQSLPPAALGALADVQVGEPKDDEVLTFADGAWTNRPASGRAGDAFAAAHAGAAGAEAHPVATPAEAGFMAAEDKQKLDRIEPGATADQTGAELVEAIDGELGGSDWRQEASAWGEFHGKSLGAGLVERAGAIDIDVASVVASVPRTRAISGPAGEDPSISLELPAAVDRRDFLLGFTATGAVTTTKVATAADMDALVQRGISVVASMAELRATKSRAGGAVVFLRGYRAPLDGGEGFFVWDPASTAADDGGTVITVAGSAGRWRRLFSAGTVVATWFDSIPSMLSYSVANRPITVELPRGRWDFSGLEIPTGITFVGVGYLWAAGQPTAGFGNGNLGVGNVLAELLRQLGFGLCRSEPGDAERTGQREGDGAVGQHHELSAELCLLPDRDEQGVARLESVRLIATRCCGKGSQKQSNDGEDPSMHHPPNGPSAQTFGVAPEPCPKILSRRYL